MEICNWWEGGAGGHPQDMTETWDEGGTQESMGVILAITHYTGDTELAEGASCSQAGTPVEQQGHQSTHKTFKPKCILSTRNAEEGDRAKTKGTASQ